jgi:hypothetical protein
VEGGKRRADAAGNVIVSRRNVADDRSENVKRSTVTDFDLPLDVHFDLIDGNVAGTLDHHLAAEFPTPLGKSTHYVEFRKLSGVRCVVKAAGP